MQDIPPDIFESEDEPGVCEVLISPEGIIEIESRLARHNLSIIHKEEALWDTKTGKCLDLFIKIEGSPSDIQFALDDCIKLIRPYPKR